MGDELKKSQLSITKTVDELQTELSQIHIETIRKDLKENKYILEAVKVLYVGAYRCAIGMFWNATVEDLRNKIICRGPDLFNKKMKKTSNITKYEDFEDSSVPDEKVVEGAYKIDILSKEAYEDLKRAKETRNKFFAHPSNEDLDPSDALAMMRNCIKYVLSQEYPMPVPNIDNYITNMEKNNFDKSEISITNTVSKLPKIYKNEMANRLFDAYIDDNCSDVFCSNIETVARILGRTLSTQTAKQIAHEVDRVIGDGNAVSINRAFNFVSLIKANKYLTSEALKSRLLPVIQKLIAKYGDFKEEIECINKLSIYADCIPQELLSDYVWGLTQTYVGVIGAKRNSTRTDFYADNAGKIPEMFKCLDKDSAYAFVYTIKTNKKLQQKIIQSDEKLQRLRKLGEIVNGKVSEGFDEKEFLEILLDEKREREFFEILNMAD